MVLSNPPHYNFTSLKCVLLFSTFLNQRLNAVRSDRKHKTDSSDFDSNHFDEPLLNSNLIAFRAFKHQAMLVGWKLEVLAEKLESRRKITLYDTRSSV